MNELTVSEKFFENVCQRKSWKCERIMSTSASKSHDFNVTISRVKIAVEVKEFAENEASRSLGKKMECTPAGEAVICNPKFRGGQIESKMKDASKQFKASANGFPTLLVLQDVSFHGTRAWDAFIALKYPETLVPMSEEARQRLLNGGIFEIMRRMS